MRRRLQSSKSWWSLVFSALLSLECGSRQRAENDVWRLHGRTWFVHVLPPTVDPQTSHDRVPRPEWGGFKEGRRGRARERTGNKGRRRTKRREDAGRKAKKPQKKHQKLTTQIPTKHPTPTPPPPPPLPHTNKKNKNPPPTHNPTPPPQPLAVDPQTPTTGIYGRYERWVLRGRCIQMSTMEAASWNRDAPRRRVTLRRSIPLTPPTVYAGTERRRSRDTDAAQPGSATGLGLLM